MKPAIYKCCTGSKRKQEEFYHSRHYCDACAAPSPFINRETNNFLTFLASMNQSYVIGVDIYIETG